MMDIDYLLTATRSVRRMLDVEAPVDREAIRDCLRIACQAANGTNMQTWRWVVVSDPELRRQIASLYRDAYLSPVGRDTTGEESFRPTPFGRIMKSTEWLVDHLGRVPLHVIPCYKPYLEQQEESSFTSATLYGSIFPAVWNFQLALHTRGYGTCITTLHLHREEEVRRQLGIPPTYVQGCLLPVGRLRAGHKFRPARRRTIDEVVACDGWDGPAL